MLTFFPIFFKLIKVHDEKKLSLDNLPNIITKSFLEISNEKYYYSTSIPNNLFNSFVTIYKMYEKNNSLDFKFKVDHMAFLGSGFIYDKQADTFVIKNNDDFYFATVSGLHKDSDICVMKINSEEQFSHISLDSRREDLKQGEPVIAYGQIQNFDKETYSIGVVNQPKQTFSKFENFNENKKACLYPFIQISNPINKGSHSKKISYDFLRHTYTAHNYSII
ncbi:trypsin-like serine protease, putative [Plasmodium malariae]|uniref:Trypsin-like serine protease, putative n=1 Tax=Plasmodium malariae TaxID=5858 RepID=A0A1A8WBZ2_PLAMA|nr:trypsin-like serine protease, putative [Plasmodium malariae]